MHEDARPSGDGVFANVHGRNSVSLRYIGPKTVKSQTLAILKLVSRLSPELAKSRLSGFCLQDSSALEPYTF